MKTPLPSRSLAGARLLAPALALPLALLGAVSCAQINPLPQLGFVTGQDSREERAIAERMRPYTGRIEVYHDFITVFTARGLYLAPEVRGEASAWEVKSRLLDPAEAKALTDRLVAPGGERVEFLVGFYAPDEKRSRLDDPEGKWEVVLRLADGRQIRSTCLTIGQEEGAPYMRFLRWDLSWSRLYRICFPLRPDDPALAQGMTLSIGGPDGRGEMAFPPPKP
jgi:hypothetical protein